jgi:hypothetical protein
MGLIVNMIFNFLIVKSNLLTDFVPMINSSFLGGCPCLFYLKMYCLFRKMSGEFFGDLNGSYPTSTTTDEGYCNAFEKSLSQCAQNADSLNFYYKSRTYIPGVNGTNIPVEATFHYRLTRTSGSNSLGEVLYTTTLLPGETVKMFVSDSRSEFNLDADTSLSTKQTTSSEETQYMNNISSSMNNLNSTNNTQSNSSSNSSQSNWNAGGSAGLDLGFLSIGGGGGGGGASQSSNNVADTIQQVSQAAHAAAQSSELAVKTSNSISIGEVQSRNHVSTESDDQYESYSRQVTNPNTSHAVNYVFYRINKCNTVTYELVDVTFRFVNYTDSVNYSNTLLQNAPRITFPFTLKPSTIYSNSVNTLKNVAQNISSLYNASGPLSAFSARNNILAANTNVNIGGPLVVNPTLNFLSTSAINTLISEGIYQNENVINSLTSFIANIIVNADTCDDTCVIPVLYNPCSCLKAIARPSTIVFKFQSVTCDGNNVGSVTSGYTTACIWTQNILLPTPGVYVKGYMDPCNVFEDRPYVTRLNLQKLAANDIKLSALAVAESNISNLISSQSPQSDHLVEDIFKTRLINTV